MLRMCATIGRCSRWISKARERSRLPNSLRLQIDNLAFSGRDRSCPDVIGLGGEFVHEIVVVRRIVMKYAEVFDLSFIYHTHAAHPCRMAPPSFGCHFALSECCIVNRKVCLAGKRNHLGIALAGKTFGVAKQRECPATVLKTVTVGAVRMIEQSCSQCYFVMRPQNIAGLEIAKFYLCLEDFYRYWKPGRTHEFPHDM